MSKTVNKLKTDYNNARNAYVLEYCKKQGLEFEAWIGDVLVASDYFLDFNEVRYDIDTKQPKGWHLEYYDYALSVHEMNKDKNLKQIHLVNYKQFCKLKKS